MSKGGVIGSIIGSVFITLVVVYFIVPGFTPGIVLQTQSRESTSNLGIYDDSTATWAEIPDMEINITTQGNSRLNFSFYDTFDFQIFSTIDPTANNQFNISIVVVGVINKTAMIGLALGIAPTTFVHVPYTLSLQGGTPIVPAGTYTVQVMWISNRNNGHNCYLRTNYGEDGQPRLLTVKEIHG